MSSKVEIVNQALLMLGALPIISFDDESVEAAACKTLYPTAKKQTLRSYPWRCATKSASLAQLVDEPIQPEWKFLYALPDNCLRVISVFNEADLYINEVAWEVQGKRLLTRSDNIAITYIVDLTEQQLDVHVEMALVARVAVDLSYTLTASSGREAALYQQYQEKLNEARVTDRQEASHANIRIDTLDRVRR